MDNDIITNDIPQIDWNDPASIVTSSPSDRLFEEPHEATYQSPTSNYGQDQFVHSSSDSTYSGNTSIRSRLFDNEEDYAVEENNDSGRSSEQRNRENTRIHTDARIVGWSKTVGPQSSTPADSVKARTKRRKGW